MAVSIDRAIRRGLITAALVAAGHATPAFAFEFGALSVHSHLDQPLDATVNLDHLDATERASLDVGIAPAAMFQRFGIRRSSAVDQIKITTQTAADGHRAVVHITTQRPISEPFVDFLLQVDSGNGSALREYTAMLDPASMAETAGGAASNTTDRTATTARPQPRHRTDGRRSARVDVEPGDTLWSIAAHHTPSGATVGQTMLAVYRANPSAFAGSMNALSQQARLSIPSAAIIRAVNTTTAGEHLQSLDHDQEQPGGAPDSDRKLAASGEAPPASLQSGRTGNDAPSADPAPKTRSGSSPADESDATPHASSAAKGVFGQLSLPAATAWPAAQKSGDVASTTTPTASGANAATPAHAAATSSAAASSVSSPPATASDVSESEGGGWFSPRNLLLLIVLLVSIGLAARRLRERGYRPVGLESENAAPEHQAPESAPVAPAARAAPPSVSTATDTPPVREAEPTPVVSVPPAPVVTGAAPTPANAAGDGPAQSPQPGVAWDSTSAEEAAADASTRPDEVSRNGPPAQGGPSVADASPLRFEPLDPETAAGEGLLAPRRPATNEEIEALAFEPQPLPDTGERRHDRGSADAPGLEFDETWLSSASRDRAAHSGPDDSDYPAREENREPYGLEMIDPGEFDLYDPPSDTGRPNDDDANDSVEIRLDLARMYIEMDDGEAARSLLDDVCQRGDDTQRAEARALLERI